MVSLAASLLLAVCAAAAPSARPFQPAAQLPGDAVVAQSSELRRLRILGEFVAAKGMKEIAYKGGLAALLGVPDPTPTRTELRSARKTTDGWRHTCSVTLQERPGAKPAPGEFIFWASRKEGRSSDDFYARVSSDGLLLRAIIREVRPPDPKAKRPQDSMGSILPITLDVKSREAKDLARHELDLWLYGAHLKPGPKKSHVKAIESFGKKKRRAAGKAAPEPEEASEGAPEED